MTTLLELAGGFVLLLFGAEYLVRGAVSLAHRLRVSPMVIGLTIVAYGTTAPELVVSLQAALSGQPGIAVGNVVGSNIANILLILGTSAAVFPIACHPRRLFRDGAVMLGSAFLFVALALSGTISQVQGMLMVAALLSYSVYAYWAERRRNTASDVLAQEVAEFEEGPKSLWLAAVAVLGGIASVVIGARLLVSGAVAAARALGVGEEVIGLTLVAVGTSLPELATAVVAAWRRHSEVAIGNVIGANIYNLLAIMGLVSAVTPIEVPPQILRFDLWLMLGVTLALLGTIAVRRGLDRRVAAAFLGAYAAYVAAQYYGVETLLGGLGGHP
jgi:cation:H+ antiporter